MRLRREHMGRSSTGMGKNAQVRCVAEGFQARLLFDGQVCNNGSASLLSAVRSSAITCNNPILLIVLQQCVVASC